MVMTQWKQHAPKGDDLDNMSKLVADLIWIAEGSALAGIDALWEVAQWVADGSFASKQNFSFFEHKQQTRHKQKGVNEVDKK